MDWLVDVGFGARSHCPPAIGRRREREDLGGTFLIVEAGQDSARGGGADPDRATWTWFGTVAACIGWSCGPELRGTCGRGAVKQHLTGVALHAVAGLFDGSRRTEGGSRSAAEVSR